MKTNTTRPSRADSLLRHPLILPLYLPALLLSVAQGLIVPVLPLFARGFDADYLWVGLVLSGEGLGMLLGDLPAGVIMRRLDQRRGMLLGIALIGTSTLALFWANGIFPAFVLRVLAGMGSAMYNVSRHTFIASTITVATRGRSVAMLGGTFRMGRAVGPIAGGAIAAAGGLRSAFLVYALVTGLAALAILVFNRRAIPTSAHHAPVTVGSVLGAFRKNARRLAAPGTGHILMQMVRSGPQVIIPLYASAVLGLDVQTIGWIFGAASAVDMTLFYPTGIIMDRFGRKWAVVPSAAVMGLGLAIIPFATSIYGLLAAAILNGIGNGLGSGVMLTIGADLVPKDQPGDFLGAWNLLGDSGTTGGPLVVGAVADLMALQPAAWTMAGVGLAASLVFGLLVPETLEKKPAPSAAGKPT